MNCSNLNSIARTDTPTALSGRVANLPRRSCPARARRPRVDVYSDADEVKVVTELPGVEPGSIDIEYSEKALVLSCGRGAGSPAEEATAIAVERTSAPMSRVIQLPCVVDGSRAGARLSNGVLTIVLPRAHPVRIEISDG